jgi:hypothetical protein
VSHASVTVEQIIANLTRNAEAARKIISRTVKALDLSVASPHANALKNAIITNPDFVPERVKRDLAPIIGKYVK